MAVRFFAGAQAAAGVGEERVQLPPGATVGGLVDVLVDRHGEGLAKVLAASSFIVDEIASDAYRPLADGATVDVLPPFAGG